MSPQTVKTREIHDVREALSHDAAQQALALQQFGIVARWVDAVAQGTSVLEIGCGQGRLSQHLNARYHGIDPIRHDQLVEGFEFRIGTGERIPHEDDSFDCVLVKDAVNYFADLRPVLQEASRVLKPGGALLMTEFVGPKYHPLKQKAKNFVKRVLRMSRGPWDKTYLNHYTSADILAAAHRCGFVGDYRYSRSDRRYYLVLRNGNPR
jgi:ubiquinone/menaquinone biosynthesis C-methylase UbiE